MLRAAARRILDKPDCAITVKIGAINDEELLKGCRALITGASRGIGREIAIRIVQSGGRCIVTGRDEEKMRELSQEYPEIKYIQQDVRDFVQFSSLFEEAKAKVGGTINTLVLNAGISNHEGSILDVSIDSFNDQFDTNVKANYFMLKEYAKIIMREPREERNVLLISSETADMPYDIPYGMTKAALNSLMEGFSHRFYKYGCRINGIAPGEVYTDMEKKSGVSIDDYLGYARKNSMGRMMNPKEIAEVAIFLLSNRSICISGEVIHCNANNHRKSYVD